jgi:hypothetical protein
LGASAFNGSSAVSEDFRWLVEAANNNSSNASATLNLQFGANGATPNETGLSIASNGIISFAANQTFPGAGGSGTVTSVGSGAGLSGGPITTSGMLSIATGGVTNAMLANPSLTVTAGTDLTGGGMVSLGGNVTLNLDTTQVPTLAAASNIFTGSLAASSFSGNGSALTSLNPANLSAGTAGINVSGNAATAASATTAATAGNALSLGGVVAGNYARLDIGNSFTGNQSVSGNVSATGSVSGATASFSGVLTAAGAVLPARGTATATQGFNSNPMDLLASSFNSGTSAAVPQLFRWQAEAAGNDTGSPSGTLNLLYLSGSGTPVETGLSIASNGQLSFAPGQTFPGGGGGTITGVTAGTDLTGGGSTGVVTLNLDTTQVPTLAAASNIFTGSIAAASFTGNGSGLTSVNPANLSAGTAGINISGNAATATTAATASSATTAGNALSLGGVGAGNYARLDIGNSFTGNQSVTGDVSATGTVSGGAASFTGGLSGTTATFSGGLTAGGAVLPATGTATASQGFNSNPMDLLASSFNSGISAAVPQLFRWQAEAAGNDTGSPSGTLNLLYLSGSGTPVETGLSIASNGQVTFAPGQTFPATGTGTGTGTITGVTAGTGLTGGGSTGVVTLNLDTSKVPTLAAASNTFTGSVTASSFSGNGSALTGLNPANLSVGTAGIDISGNAASATAAASATTAATAGNALSLGGVVAGDYARLDIGNSFTGNQSVSGNVSATGSVSGGAASFTGGLSGTTATFSGGLTAGGAVLPATGTATASQGFNSNPMDLLASSFNSGISAAVPQLFRWQAEPAGNDTGSPSGTLNLLYLSGNGTPVETGLSIASNGQLSFAPGQTFPGAGSGTVTSVGSGAGLTGGPITGSGTLSIATGGVTNAMLANPSLTVAAGTDLTGGGSVPLGGSVKLNLDTTKVPTLAASSNAFTGSLSAASFSGSGTGLTNLNVSNLTSGTLPSSVLSGTYSQAVTFSNASNSFSGNGAGLTNLAPGNLSAGTAGINISGNAATATNAAELGGLGAGAFAQLGAASNTFTGGLTASSFSGNGSGLSSVNAAQLGGLASSAFAQLGTANTFSLSQTLAGGGVLPATGTATSSQGYKSGAMDALASAYNSGTSAAVNELFRWQAEPVGNNTSSPSASLNLLFGSGGGTPAETGLSIASNGQVSFASGQTFPGTGTVSSVGSGAGLTGGPITSSGTLSIATGGVTNAMLANSSLTVTAGSGLSGGGAVALGGSTALSVASGGVTNAMLANPSLTVTAGSGLSGGGAVALGGSTSLSVASGGVTNAMLANPSLTVAAGTALTGGGSVALGSSVTLNVDTTKVPTLGASSNTFAGSISAASFSGNGANLSSLTPGNLSAGTAGINISGNAATATNATELGGLGAGSFAQLGASGPMAFPVLNSASQLATGTGAIGFTLGDVANSSPLTTSELAYFTVPRACTISGYDLMIDTGTITVKFLKVATGTAVPTLASNSISTNGVSISSGTAIHSTTTSDFTTTTVNAFDIMGVAITAVSGAHYLTAEVECK